MQNPSFRFLTATKKAILIKLVSILCFVGILGASILGCEKPLRGFRDAAWENQDEKEQPAAYVPPVQGNEWLDKQGIEGIKPTNVAGP